jgi:hypothetical protein
VYAGCVYWPLHLEHRTGLTVAIIIIALSVLTTIVKIAKHLIQKQA